MGRLKTHEEFEYEIQNKFDNNVVVIGKYVNQKTKIEFYCNKCNNTWFTSPMSILRTTVGCPECANKVISQKNATRGNIVGGRFVDLFPDLATRFDYDKNVGINIQDLAAHSGKYVWWKCDICGHSWQSKIATVANGKGNCPECYRKNAVNHIIIARLNKNGSLADNYPDLLAEWDYEKNTDIIPSMVTVKSNRKVWWKCTKCGREWQTTIAHRVEGKGCPYCYRFEKSNLQKKVQKYIENKYDYNCVYEYDCSLKCRNPKTNHLLPYDNELIVTDNIRIIIECHGEQHYKICGLTNLAAKKYNTTPEESLKYIQWRDEYKKQYALSNGYYYLAIPYWTECDESYKILIDEKIQQVLNNTKLTNQ